MTTIAAIILAGGDGTRLLPLTRRLTGDGRPKQFCALVGEETLLEQTRRRVARLVAPEQVLLSVTRSHAPYYQAELAAVPSRNIVAQPANRGTAPAILYALTRLNARACADAVVIQPSDHYVSDDEAVMSRVASAVGAVRVRPDIVVLLGIEPDCPETEYGWIEPAEALPGLCAWPLYHVRCFWEKPPLEQARRLMQEGSLWNSFVIVANPSTLERQIRSALPTLAADFEPMRASVDTPSEEKAARALYARLPTIDFSRAVLERHPGHLAVMPIRSIRWNDLGNPERVLATQRGLATAAAQRAPSASSGTAGYAVVQ